METVLFVLDKVLGIILIVLFAAALGGIVRVLTGNFLPGEGQDLLNKYSKPHLHTIIVLTCGIAVIIAFALGMTLTGIALILLWALTQCMTFCVQRNLFNLQTKLREQ